MHGLTLCRIEVKDLVGRHTETSNLAKSEEAQPIPGCASFFMPSGLPAGRLRYNLDTSAGSWMDRLPDVDPSTAIERVDTRSTQIVGPDPGAGRQAPRALGAQYGRAEHGSQS